MRILVVEDEKKVASFIQRGLEGEGFSVDVLEAGGQRPSDSSHLSQSMAARHPAPAAVTACR